MSEGFNTAKKMENNSKRTSVKTNANNVQTRKKWNNHTQRWVLTSNTQGRCSQLTHLYAAVAICTHIPSSNKKKIHCNIIKTANKQEYHTEVFHFLSKGCNHNLESSKITKAIKESCWRTGTGTN